MHRPTRLCNSSLGLRLIIGAVSVCAVACTTRRYISEEDLATLTVCPYGVDDDVTGTFDADCVRELFGQDIRLLEPPDGYTNPSFRISTPAVPAQLKVVFGAKDGDEERTIRLDIDPTDVLPLFLPIDEIMVGQHKVGVAEPVEGRTHFYWQEGRWRYSLDAPTENADEFEAAVEMIGTAN
jgi:hypothetical protein